MKKYLHAIFAFSLIFAVQGGLWAQPANDECADAISVGLGSHDFSTVDATTGIPGYFVSQPAGRLGGVLRGVARP